jgi:hypothetical protein
MLSQINIKVIWKTKNFFVSLRKTIYIMIILAKYFLIGIITSALLEGAIVKAGYPMEWSDRFWVILGWPLASAIFIVNFIKGYLGKD